MPFVVERLEQSVALLNIAKAAATIQQQVEYGQVHRQRRDVVAVEVRGNVDPVALCGDLFGADQEVGGTAGGIDDALIAERIDDLDNQPDDLAGGEVLTE